jgi:hypothetical protein
VRYGTFSNRRTSSKVITSAPGRALTKGNRKGWSWQDHDIGWGLWNFEIRDAEYPLPRRQFGGSLAVARFAIDYYDNQRNIIIFKYLRPIVWFCKKSVHPLH